MGFYHVLSKYKVPQKSSNWTVYHVFPVKLTICGGWLFAVGQTGSSRDPPIKGFSYGFGTKHGHLTIS